MFEKNHSINTGRLTTFAPMTVCLTSRVVFLNDKEVLVITNDEKEYLFNIYKRDGSVRTIHVDISHGQILSAFPFKDDIIVEFRFIETTYEEEYSIVRISKGEVKPLTSFRRESYLHDMQYHSLFEKDGELYLHLICHNRLHHFIIKDTAKPAGSMAEELDVLEGGKWYLCGSFPVCAMRNVVELYDPSLNICSTVEYDYEIDELLCDEAPNMLAFAMSDFAQEQTALMIYQADSDTLHITYLEHTVSSMGLSAGRVWLNPYGFHEQQELGGCMIYDRYAWPLYIHLRTKGGTGGLIGTYAPPFHRCEHFYALSQGMTGVTERNKLLILDFSARPVQEIMLEDSSLFAISPDGSKVAVLTLNNLTSSEETVIHENTALTVYEWVKSPDDSKVIDMSRFQR